MVRARSIKERCCPLARFDKPGRFHYACNDPDKCMNCGEPNTPYITGPYRCKCDVPKGFPRNPDDDRPSARVRYGQ